MQQLIIGLIYEGGPIITIPIALTFLAIVITTVKLSIGMFSQSEKDPRSFTWGVNAIVAMGFFAFVLGLFGQNLGMIEGLNAIEQMGGVSPAMLAGGLKVAMIAPTMGMSVLLIAGILWFILRTRQQQLLSQV